MHDSVNRNTELVAANCAVNAIPHHVICVDAFSDPLRLDFSVGEAEAQTSIFQSQLSSLGITGIYNATVPGIERLTYRLNNETGSFIDTERYSLLFGALLSTARVKWMNGLAASEIASHKPFQLGLARKIGFSIPETLISSDKASLVKFWQMHSEDVVTKAVRNGLISSGRPKDSVAKVLFTSVVTHESLASLPERSVAPIVFQRRINKQRELRIVVVNDRIFACAFNPSVNHVDWRRYRAEASGFSAITLEATLAEKCLNLMRALGLRFGVFDIVQDTQGTYYFLEVNQQGNWFWIETILGLQISDAIVSDLSRE